MHFGPVSCLQLQLSFVKNFNDHFVHDIPRPSRMLPLAPICRWLMLLLVLQLQETGWWCNPLEDFQVNSNHMEKTFLPAFHPFLSHHVFLFHIVNFVFMFTLLYNETFHQDRDAAATSALNPATIGSRMVTTAIAGALTKRIGLLLRTSAGIRAATWLPPSQMPPKNMSSREWRTEAWTISG